MMYEQRVQRTADAPAIRAEGLGKRYGDLWALRDLELEVPTGSVLGLLGHNGAGKTTAIRILTTLAAPTTGRATVTGLDVVADAKRVRTRIGLAGQSAAVDGLMSGRANLEMIGRLYHLPRASARRRAAELLERFDLASDADRLVRTYSGGMSRRLDVAASLVASPPVLFLDEPTTGLDPRGRNDLWDLLRELVDEGATLVLTTQYLEEADRLADEIVVLDHGRIAASGSPAELKAHVGGERVTVTVPRADQLAAAVQALAPFADGPELRDDEALSISVPLRGRPRLIELVRALDAADVDVTDLARREPSLDDVFLALTDPTRKAAA
jgi:ABC-2 type transport system ATP-binding protein